MLGANAIIFAFVIFLTLHAFKGRTPLGNVDQEGKEVEGN
jgi:hypothetical protein